MRHISVDPPPFFHRGPSPLARLAFFGLVSLVLLFADTRFRYLEEHPPGRRHRAVSDGARCADARRTLAYVGGYFASQRALGDRQRGVAAATR